MSGHGVIAGWLSLEILSRSGDGEGGVDQSCQPQARCAPDDTSAFPYFDGDVREVYDAASKLWTGSVL